MLILFAKTRKKTPSKKWGAQLIKIFVCHSPKALVILGGMTYKFLLINKNLHIFQKPIYLT